MRSLLENLEVIDFFSIFAASNRQYVKLKNFRLWKTQDSKKLKIVLNFQDCLVVSNLLCTFAMSNRREKAKAKSQVLYNQQRREEMKNKE